MSAPGREGLPQSNHQTLAVTELHRLNSQGLPEFQSLSQQIVAVRHMESVPYITNPDQIDIERIDVLTGFREVRDPYTASGRQVYDLVLDRPLLPGEQTELTFNTSFHSKKPPPHECIRGIGMLGMSKWDVTVVFAGDKLPESIWWGRYEASNPNNAGILNPVGPSTKVPLLVRPEPGDGREVRHVQENLGAGAIYGFRWNWGDAKR